MSNPVPTSDQVFQEAFAAAGGISESTETVDLQDNSSGTDTDISEEEGQIAIPETQDELSEETSETIPDTDEPELSNVIKEVVVKDKEGKRKNIKVDFSDHNKMTKYVQKAANAVRLQSERDALQAQVSKLEEASSAMANLQEIVDTKGFEGLIEQLNADNGGFKAWMESKITRHEARLHASEDELARLDAEDKASDLQRRLDRIEQQQLQREEKVTEDRNKAELDKKQSEINPIFFKHTFDGKLGDAVMEQRQNRLMFREVTETLDNLAEEGVKITPAIIEREFKSYSAPLLKGVNRRVRQNTKRAIDQKKAEATTHAQQRVRQGYNNDSVDSAMQDRNWAGSLAKLWAQGKLK
jgi:hypothetical protein